MSQLTVWHGQHRKAVAVLMAGVVVSLRAIFPRFLVLAALISVGVATFVGCGGGGGEGTQDTPATQTGFELRSGLAALEGTWQIVGVNTGDASKGEWNGWVEGSVTINLGGRLTNYTLRYDDGTVDSIPTIDRVWISKDGIITSSADPNFYGVLSLDQDTIVVTYTDPAGGHTMLLLQRSPANVTMGNFVGLWHQQSIAAGDGPNGWAGWQRGEIEIEPSGKANLNLTSNAGGDKSGYSTLQLSSNGALENVFSSAYLSRDGQIAIGRETDRSGFLLTTLLKDGGNFTPLDLEGSWSFHILSSGDDPQVNAWGHGMMTLDATGNSIVNYQVWSNIDSVLEPGNLAIDAQGVITSSAIPDLQGKLSKNKDILSATFTNASGGGSFLIALRRDPLPVQIVPVEGASVSAMIGPGGGTMQAVAQDGTIFDFTIPADALESDITIKLTPITSINGLGSSLNYLTAVHFAPEGLQLNVPAELVVTSPVAANPEQLVGYEYSGGVFNFVPLLPVSIAPSGAGISITSQIWHFSASGVATGTTVDLDAVFEELNIPTIYPDPETKRFWTSLANIMKRIMQEWVDASLKGEAYDVKAEVELRAGGVLHDWFANVLLPRMERSYSIEQMELSVKEYLRWEAVINSISQYTFAFCEATCDGNIDKVYENARFAVASALSSNIDPRIDQLEAICNSNCRPMLFLDGSYSPAVCDNLNTCYKRDALLEAEPWIKFNEESRQEYFPGLTEHLPWEFCGGIGTQLARSINLKDRLTDQVIGLLELQPSETKSVSGKWIPIVEHPTGERLVENWISRSEKVASVDYPGNIDSLSADVTGLSEGVSLIDGGDPEFCLFDTAIAVVGDPMKGFWNIQVRGRPLDTCLPDVPTTDYTAYIPAAAVPWETTDVRIDVINGSAEWRDLTPPLFRMSGSISQGVAEVAGGSPTDVAQQGCTIRQTGVDSIVGECSYTSYANPFDICKGHWIFSGTRIGSAP